MIKIRHGYLCVIMCIFRSPDELFEDRTHVFSIHQKPAWDLEQPFNTCSHTQCIGRVCGLRY